MSTAVSMTLGVPLKHLKAPDQELLFSGALNNCSRAKRSGDQGEEADSLLYNGGSHYDALSRVSAGGTNAVFNGLISGLDDIINDMTSSDDLESSPRRSKQAKPSGDASATKSFPPSSAKEKEEEG